MTSATTTMSAPRQVAMPAARFLAFIPPVLAHVALAALVLFAFSELVMRPGRTVDGHDMTQSFNWESFNRLALAEGSIPWWNPYLLSGLPAAADIQTQLFYPLNLPLRLLPIQSFFTWGMVLHVWIAGAGVMALCRVIGTGWLPAFIAGAGFALGGTYAPRVHAGHIMLIYGWAWLPVALALAIVSVRRRTWIPHPALPAVLTIQFLTGHLQTTIYVYAAVGAFYVYAWWASARSWSVDRLNWRAASQWVMTLVLLSGLAAFMLLPTIGLVKELGRTAGLSYDSAARNSWDAFHLVTLVAPESMNSIRAEPNDDVRGSHWERSAYSGALLVLLAPLGFILAGERRRYAVFFGVLALAALAFSFGRNAPFFYLHYLVLPGLRHASRILPLFSLGVVVLGALGLNALMQTRQFSRPLILGLLASETIFFGVLIWMLHLDSNAPVSEVLGAGIWLLPIQIAGIAALIVLPGRWGAPMLTSTLLSLFLLTELSQYARPFIQGQRVPDLRQIDTLFNREQIDRVVTNCDGVLQPNDMAQLSTPTVNGYNSVFLQSYSAFTYLTMLNHIPIGTKQVHSIAVDTNQPGRIPERMDLLNLMNVTHVLACKPLQVSGFIEVQRRNRDVLYRNVNAEPRAILTCGFEEVRDRDAAIDRVRDTSLDLRERTIVQTEGQRELSASLKDVSNCRQGSTVDIPIKDRADGELVANVVSPQGGILFLSEPYYPERKGWLDGVEIPLYRANVAFSAAEMPAGTHTLELRYVPQSFWIGGMISAVAAVGWLILAVLWRRQARA